MERLTRPTVKVDETAAQYMSKTIDLRTVGDRLLELILNGPTLNGVSKDILRQMIRDLYDTLLRYEDTGLEPEDLKSNVDVDFARIIELLKADGEGRLVVLPCKVGDWVYALWSVPTDYKYVIYCAEVKEIRHSIRDCRKTTTYILEPIEYRGRRKEYRDDDIGKTVFLTREEAEKALGGGNSDDP